METRREVSVTKSKRARRLRGRGNERVRCPRTNTMSLHQPANQSSSSLHLREIQSLLTVENGVYSTWVLGHLDNDALEAPGQSQCTLRFSLEAVQQQQQSHPLCDLASSKYPTRRTSRRAFEGFEPRKPIISATVRRDKHLRA